MWEFFIKNPRFSYLALVVLVAVGGYSLLSIPRESSPEIIIPVGIVTTVLPGAPASDVETLITNEIERGLSSLAGVSSITSISQEGVSSVTVEFDAQADVDSSIQELKDEIDSIATSLPEDATDPVVSEVNFVDQPILTVALSANKSALEFSTLRDELEAEIEKIAGVSRVTVTGVPEREISVIVNQEDLLTYNLTLPDITNALRDANISLPIGQIVEVAVRYTVSFEGDIASSEMIQNVVVAVRGGAPVYVRDIGVVTDGLAPAGTITRASQNNEPSVDAITLDVYKQSGGDITTITKAVNARLAALQEPGEFLEGVAVTTVQDSGALILDDLINLGSSGLQTVMLVVLLLVFAIGWREGLIAGLAIPLSFLFGFIGLYFSGNTINFLSLFSLILGIGILVDSAIVMVEGINRRLKDNPNINKEEAALAAINEFKAPLIAGTLTTVAMFVGLFIVSGVIGQFIASIPFTLIFVLFASMFVSLAFIPLFAAHFLKRRSATRLEQKQVEYAHRLEVWYIGMLESILGNTFRERVFLWSIRFALVLALMLPVLGVVKVVFFESGDVEYVIVQVETPEGTIKETTDIAIRQAEEILYTVPEVASFVTTVGSGSQFAGGGSGEKFGNIFVTLREDRELTSLELIEKVRPQLEAISIAKVTLTQPSDGPPTGAAVLLKFTGDDFETLTTTAEQTAVLMRTIPNITNIETSARNNATEYVFTLEREKAAALGVTPALVSQIARTAVFGTEATSITSLTDDTPVVVKLALDPTVTATTDTANRASADALARLEVPTSAGPVPLSSLVDISLRESQTSIPHEDGERVVTVTADITAEGNAREAQAATLALMQRELSIPEGVTLSTGGGETDDSNQAFIEMLVALIVGVLLMVAILVLQFNSFLHTKYVLSILPYSLIGILSGLALTQNALSFPSIMGFIALSGIVVNNSILLIDMINHNRRLNPATPIRAVVIASASNRLRPILLTTLTTVIGMVPLTYAGDLWAPLAYAVMFGLVFSVLITLVLIPIAYNRKPGKVG